MTRSQPKVHVRFLEEYEFLRKYAFRCTACPEIVDNIVQDVFFKFVTNAEKWNLENDIRPILIRLTKITAADHWRRHYRTASMVRQEVARELQQIAQEINENEEEQGFYNEKRQHHLTTCLQLLSQKNRSLIEMHSAKVRVPSAYRPSSRREMRRIGILLSVLLLFFVAAIVFEFRFRPRDAISPDADIVTLARVRSLADPVFLEDAPVHKRGQFINEEEIRLESGMLELEFRNGVRVVLEGPTRFKLNSIMNSFCEFGKCSVEVPSGSEGFELFTPFLNIRDLGTEFVVHVDDKQSGVHVISGQVEVDKLSENWIIIPQGFGRVVDHVKTEKQITADKDLFVNRRQMDEAAGQYEEKCLDEWKRRREEQKTHPDLLAYVDFEHASKNKVELVSSVLDRPQKDAFEFHGMRFVTGKWQELKGVSINRPSDYATLSLPGSYRALSLVMSVKLKNIDRTNTFLIGKNFGLAAGQIAWQVNSQGQLQFHMMRDEKNVSFYDSPPNTVTFKDIDTWLQIAVVIDPENKQVTHYLDGKPVAVLPFQEKVAVSLADLYFFNDRSNTKNKTHRYMSGVVDDFHIFQRALSDKELFDLLAPL